MLSQLSYPPASGAVIQASGPILIVLEGAEIYAEGNSADTLLKVVSGIVRTCKFKSDGRRQIDAFYVQNEVFGFEAGAFHSLSAEAVSDCRLVSYRRKGVAAFAAVNQGFADQLYSYSIRSLVRSQEHSRILGHTSAVEKLAAFLIECSERSATKDLITLGMTRTDIADYLGLTVETVSRSLTQLRQGSFIELLSARHVRIQNLQRLRDLYA